MRYIEVLNSLEDSLGFKSTNEEKAKENKQLFLNAILTLKNEFKTTISTKFLMGLVSGNKKQKSNRVNYMLKSVGLTDRDIVQNVFLMAVPTTTQKKDNELFYYSRKDKTKPAEQGNIRIKVVPMTSTSEKGIKAVCNVGITKRRLKITTLHTIPI